MVVSTARRSGTDPHDASTIHRLRGGSAPTARAATAWAASALLVGAIIFTGASETSAAVATPHETVAQLAPVAPARSSAGASAADAPSEIAAVIADTNAVRAGAGLPPLRHSGALDSVATNWSMHQATTGTMAHNPDLAAQLPGAWTLGGENVAWGYSVSVVVSRWAASPEHHANLVGDFTDVGVGIARTPSGVPYYTQVFARY